jgi:hypothetical protein
MNDRISMILVCLLGEYNLQLAIQAKEIDRHRQCERDLQRACLDFIPVPDN